jgi:transcriptional regulator GlxA family with amidase domain
VCIYGSILLAATGVLDCKTATTNKPAYDKLTPLYPNVQWKRHARWVVDSRFISSSGITAGVVRVLRVDLTEVRCCIGFDGIAVWQGKDC